MDSDETTMTGCVEPVIANMPFHAAKIATIVRATGNKVSKLRLRLKAELAFVFIVDCMTA